MNLSNLKPKFKKCLGPSSIAQSLNENSCNRQLWLQNRFKSQEQDSLFLEKYKLKHASTLNILNNYLSKKIPDAKIDTEVRLPIVQFYGVNLFGIADLILINPEGKIGIYDAKTGSRKAFHWFQIAIYFLMQKAIHQSKGLDMPKLFSLGLFYLNGEEKKEEEYEKSLLEFKGDDVLDKIFLGGTKNKLKESLIIVSQDKLPEPKPSLNNCRFCKFKNDCPEALKEEMVIVADDLIL